MLDKLEKKLSKLGIEYEKRKEEGTVELGIDLDENYRIALACSEEGDLVGVFYYQEAYYRIPEDEEELDKILEGIKTENDIRG